MPEESIPPTDPTPPPEDEWTDESDFTDEETAAFSRAAKTHEDAWEDPGLDWEEDLTAPDLDPPARPLTTQEALVWARPLWRRSRRFWQRLLAGLRKRIPAAADLSDGVLSGLLLGILVVLLLSFNSVRQAAVAGEPSPLPEATPAETLPENPAMGPTGQPLTTPTVIPPPPSPEDEADRERIAQLQAQLTTGFLPSASGMIASVQADFAQNQLAVILTNDWYRLSSQAQVDLADQLRARSADLEFTDLQLRSTAGDLLARSPVVGNTMVILQGEKPPIVEPPARPRYRITVER